MRYVSVWRVIVGIIGLTLWSSLLHWHEDGQGAYSLIASFLVGWNIGRWMFRPARPDNA